jgi:hypothetical protein
MENPSRLRNQLKAHLGDLAKQVDGRAQQKGFQDALRTMALFWRYTPLNQFLIRSQRPNATHVMARLKWEAIGRKVKEGEEPIEVLAPTTPGWATSFIGVPVFDVRQTRGRRVAKLDLSLPGASQQWRRLEHAARALGVEVGYRTLPSGIRGWSLGGRIEVVPGLSGQERTAVLAHELAHEILHQAEGKRAAELARPGPRRTKAEKETEADATAYVVLAVLGLPSKAATYIAWQGGTGQAVLKSMIRVQRAAKMILEAGFEPRRVPGCK